MSETTDTKQELQDALIKAAKELAAYTSYAEIVGGVTINRVAIRENCNKVNDLYFKLKNHQGE